MTVSLDQSQSLDLIQLVIMSRGLGSLDSSRDTERHGTSALRAEVDQDGNLAESVQPAHHINTSGSTVVSK